MRWVSSYFVVICIGKKAMKGEYGCPHPQNYNLFLAKNQADITKKTEIT
jgi:hypothetical protein